MKILSCFSEIFSARFYDDLKKTNVLTLFFFTFFNYTVTGEGLAHALVPGPAIKCMRLNLDFSRFAAQIKRMRMTPEIRLHAHALKPKIFIFEYKNL